MTYILTMPNWRPHTINDLLRSVRGRIRMKGEDRDMVAAYRQLQAVPLAGMAGPRRVSVRFVYGPGERMRDVDAHQKVLL